MDPVISILLTAVISAAGNVTPDKELLESLLLDDDVIKYQVTVVGGTGSGRYEVGRSVTIRAKKDTSSEKFKEWTSTSPGVIFDNKTNRDVTFIMPSNDVTITAIYEAVKHSVTLTNGGTDSSGSGNYIAGATVMINAGTIDGYLFSHWSSSPAVVFSNPNNKETYFTMPANDIIINAHFVQILPVTVTNGTGGGLFIVGTKVIVTANQAPEGKRFSHWEIDPEVTFTTGMDASFSTVEFVMPGEPVFAIAIYEEIPVSQYTITILNNGGGLANANLQSAISGTPITITATPNLGYIFSKWEVVSDNVNLSNDKANPVNFQMPAENVVIRAIFEIDPEDPVLVKYVYPPTAVFVHEFNTLYEAKPSPYESGVFIVDEIILPANYGPEDISYTFEVYTNGEPTGITATTIVYHTNICFMEASRIITNPDQLGPTGGNIAVRIEFKIPNN